MPRYSLRTLLILLAIGPPLVAYALAGRIDGEAVAMGLLTTLMFSTVAGGTWFFASRSRLFVRTFAPRDEWRVAIRNCVRDPLFEPSMRLMAKLQFIVAAWVGAIVAIGKLFE